MRRNGNLREYIRARIAVDDESLDPRTFARFASLLRGIREPVILDIGSGSSSMIAWIVKESSARKVTIYGIDSDKDLLDQARRESLDLLRSAGFAVRSGDQVVAGTKPERSVEIRFPPGDLFNRGLLDSLEGIAFDGITSRAFFDAVPRGPSLDLVGRLLARGGFFYSTLNASGAVELVPFFEDRELEEAVLALDPGGRGARPEGDRSGRALYDELTGMGFAVAGYGSSDWSVFPWNGAYGGDEEILVNALLLSLYEEGLAHASVDRFALAAWYAERSESVERGRLSLMAHRTDILAIKS